MGFFTKLVEMFKNIFGKNIADSKQRREFKQIENELRLSEPVLYRNEELQSAFAETVYLLYQHSKPIDDILSVSLCSADTKISRYYEAALFTTGFTEEMHELYAALNYDRRRDEVRAAENETRVYEDHRKKLELFAKKLIGEQFVKIDAIILQLHHLRDICRMNFMSVLCLFDANFQAGNPMYTPNFQPAPLADAEAFLTENYRYAADFQVTEGMARAVVALETVRRRAEFNSQVVESAIMGHLKKINLVISRLLNADMSMKLMRLLKNDLTIVLEKAEYSGNALVNFSTSVRETFESDSRRIKTEIQNETVAEEIQKLFDPSQLQQVNGYSQDEDTFLQQHTSLSFQWTVPFKVFKSFLHTFFDERAQSLLNDVAIEGFFANQDYKSEFSGAVYNCCDIFPKIKLFESKFTPDSGNYSALIRSYVGDSRRDESFLRALEKLVDMVNTEAKKLLTDNCQQLANLYRRCVEVFADIRKSTPDYMTNAKVLFASIRNRDKVDYLESHFPKWKLFFEIMYNYGIVIPPDVEAK